jgi:hypothetical protein
MAVIGRLPSLLARHKRARITMMLWPSRLQRCTLFLMKLILAHAISNCGIDERNVTAGRSALEGHVPVLANGRA